MSGILLDKEKVKGLAIDNGTTFQKLGALCGHNPGYIGLKFLRNSPFSKNDAETIAKALSCKVEDISKKGNMEMENIMVYVDYELIKKLAHENNKSIVEMSAKINPNSVNRVKDRLRRGKQINIIEAEYLAKELGVPVDQIVIDEASKIEHKKKMADDEYILNMDKMREIVHTNHSALTTVSKAMGKVPNYISSMGYSKAPIRKELIEKAEKTLGFKIMDAFVKEGEETREKEYVLISDKFEKRLLTRGVTKEWVEMLGDVDLNADKFSEKVADKISFMLLSKRDDIFAEWIEPTPEPEPEPEVIPAQVGEFKIDTTDLEKLTKAVVDSNNEASMAISKAADQISKISDILKISDVLTGIENLTNKLNAVAVQNARMLEKIEALEKKVDSTPDKKELAVIFLENELKNGRMKVATIKDDAARLNLSFNDLMYAKRKLFVKAESTGVGHNTDSYWYL